MMRKGRNCVRKEDEVAQDAAIPPIIIASSSSEVQEVLKEMEEGRFGIIEEMNADESPDENITFKSFMLLLVLMETAFRIFIYIENKRLWTRHALSITSELAEIGVILTMLLSLSGIILTIVKKRLIWMLPACMTFSISVLVLNC